jgi:OOP family OmpA-OmpF porin
MTNRYLLGAGVALAVAFGGAQAHAQLFPWNQPGVVGAWYIGPEGGWTKLSNQTDSITQSQFSGPPNNTQLFTIRSGSPTANFNSGYNVGVRGGYEWGPWRLEEEYSYRNSQLSSFTGGGVFALTSQPDRFSGERTSNSIMTNLIYDFGTWGWNWWVPITPHIGAGVGASHINDSASVSNFTLRNPIGAPIVPATPLSVAPQTFGGTLLHGNSWEFAYQAIAGLRFNLSPAVSLDIDYRYMATPNFTLTNTARTPFPGGTGGTNCCANSSYHTGYNTQNIVASLTMKFGVPPAPPPPLPPAPPPPPVQKVFLVFFDWDKYNITAEGERIIELAAQQYKAGGSVKLQVTGYTDTTGSYAYNQRLSERRANAVATRLVALGVARSDMSVAGRSFNDLRVPTPPGVREPQNRRVEILFP